MFEYEKNDKTYILSDGLWRSVSAMEPVAKAMHAQGFETVGVPYGSFRLGLDAIVSQVIGLLEPWLESGRKIHFVTHSLGGVVVKRLVETLLAEGSDINFGRVVMLAPPHQGSEIVDWLSRSLVRRLLGPAGEFLTSEKMQEPQDALNFPEEVEAAVIMGKSSALPLFRKLLEASNDGIVSVEKGKLYGIKEFKVVEADHTFISSEKQVIGMVERFIEFGQTDGKS